MARSRSFRAAALTLTLLTALSCADIRELVPELPESEAAILLAFCGWLKGPKPSVFEPTELASWLANVGECETRLFGPKAGRIFPTASARAGVTPVGVTASEVFEVDGTTRAKKLPRWRAIVPPPPGDGNRSIEASVTLTTDQYDNPKKAPKKIQVTLFNVNSNGQRSQLAKQTGSIKKGRGSLVFGPLSRPADHYEVEYLLKGGKAETGTLIYSAGVRDSAAPESTAIRVEPRYVGIHRTSASATSTALLVFGSYEIVGNVGAGAMPQFTADLMPTDTSASGGSRTVLATLLAVDDQYQVPGDSPRELTATLFDVDRNGNRTRIGNSTVKVEDGGAQIEFEGLAAPRDHFQVAFSPSGGGGASGTLMYMAGDGSDAAARVYGRILGTRGPR